MRIKFSLIFLRAKLVLMPWMHDVYTQKGNREFSIKGSQTRKVFLSTAANFRWGIFKQLYPFLGVLFHGK